jgi:hypothetical protein
MTTLSSKTLWKRASNGLIAHIYEHIASSFITKELEKAGLSLISDYDHWARTFGSVMYIYVRLHSKKAKKEFRSALDTFNSTGITFDMAQHAAQQVSIEYERTLQEFTDEFVNELRALHKEIWKDISTLPAFQADTETSVNTVFSSPGITYSKVLPKKFADATIHFEVNKKLYQDNAALKALSVLIVQAVALNLHRSLEDDYLYYDIGDEWDNGADPVAYRTTLSFSKDASPHINTLRTSVDFYVQELKNRHFSKSLQVLLNHTYKDDSVQYFSLETMNSITNGIIIGHAGWKTVSDIAIIETILDSVKVKVLS